MSSTPKSLSVVYEHLDLDALERAIPDLGEIPREEVPEVLARLTHIQSRLAALTTGLVNLLLAQTSAAPVAPEQDRLLSVEEAAKILGVRKDYVYEHQSELPAVRNGRRLLFSALRLQRYVNGRVRGSIPHAGGSR